MTKKLIITAIGFCLLFTMIIPSNSPTLAQSQDPITVGSSTVEVDYPNSLTFSCHVQDDTNVTDVRLEYKVQQMSFAQVTSEAQVTFNPST